MDKCQELSYLGYVIQEALRVNPPAPLCSHYHFEKDTKLGGLHVRAYDPILINIYALHHDSSQW